MNLVSGVNYLQKDSKYWFALLIPSLLISGGPMLETTPHAVIRSGILQAQARAWGFHSIRRIRRTPGCAHWEAELFDRF